MLEAGQQAVLPAQAGGNPLYAEQYVQMLAEQQAGPELPLPESVQGIISARLAHHYLSALDLARATDRDAADLAARARSALQGAGDRAFALNAHAAAAGFYRAALGLWPEDAGTAG